MQRIHHRQNIGCQQLIREWPRVACAAAVATTVYQNGTIAAPDYRWNLITPIAAVAESAVQQDHRRAGPVSGVPDPSTLVFDVAVVVRGRQRCGAVRFELP